MLAMKFELNPRGLVLNSLAITGINGVLAQELCHVP